MDYHNKPKIFFTFSLVLIFFISCNNVTKPVDKQIVSNPQQMDQQISDDIKDALKFSSANNGKVDDSITLSMDSVVDYFYSSSEYQNIWSHNEKWEPLADSLYHYIKNAELSGLFPNDYHF